MPSEEVLNDEQDIYDAEEQIYSLKRQVLCRQIATLLFASLAIVCLIARVVAL